MIKTTPHEPLSEEQDKRETIMCIVYASVIVLGMLALLLHGMAFLSWTEPTMEEIYARNRMEREIEVLENRVQSVETYMTGLITVYGKHTHRYFDGKIKLEKAK